MTIQSKLETNGKDLGIILGIWSALFFALLLGVINRMSKYHSIDFFEESKRIFSMEYVGSAEGIINTLMLKGIFIVMCIFVGFIPSEIISRLISLPFKGPLSLIYTRIVLFIAQVIFVIALEII